MQIHIPNYDIKNTLLGGQSFCWTFDGVDTYTGFDHNQIIIVKVDSESINVKSSNDALGENEIKHYLGLNVDFENIVKNVEKDEHVKQARLYYPNLRILRQNSEIAFFSFIISQNNNLTGIRNRIRRISKKFGDKVTFESTEYYLFPKAEKLAQASINDLLECGLGYRAKYVHDAAKRIVSNGDFNKVISLNDEIATLEYLKSFNGIGNKVADCIMLYGMAYDNIFPIDLWGKRIVEQLYNKDFKKYEDVRKWSQGYFEGYAGWAGQFLFEYARNQLKLK